jgi:uncharacterized protein YdhG (YjbR/CyaY superfamily)
MASKSTAKKAPAKKAPAAKATGTKTAATKTAATSVKEYLDALEEPRKSEIKALHRLIVKSAPKLAPTISSGMLGYGKYHYKYSSGREGDTAVVALASQKNYISLYACSVVDGGYVAEKYRDRLPRASIGKGCIRFKTLAAVDLDVLAELVKECEKAGGMGAVS